MLRVTFDVTYFSGAQVYAYAATARAHVTRGRLRGRKLCWGRCGSIGHGEARLYLTKPRGAREIPYGCISDGLQPAPASAKNARDCARNPARLAGRTYASQDKEESGFRN